MILWEIFRAVDLCAGIDSGAEFVYNILQGKQQYKEGIIMSELAEARMEVCHNHPERQQIFHLEKMLIEAGYPYYFNFWEDLRPTPFNQDGGDPEKDIDWDAYNFLIEVGSGAGDDYAAIAVTFSRDNKTLLEVVEENRTRYDNYTSEQAMELIEGYFQRL